MFDHDRIDIFVNKNPDYIPSIYVDVDGTLLFGTDGINKALVKELRKVKEKYGDKIDIIVWSTGGKKYAKDCMEMAEIEDIVSYCLSKPLYVVDDCGDLWHFNMTQFIENFPIGKD